LFALVKTGFSPQQGDPTAWYDRTIRVIGGIVLFVFFLAMIVVGWMNVTNTR
jgi:hypothetical protein